MSPSGLQAFEKTQSIISARRSASSGGGGEVLSYFGITDGQTARVRFLEQGDEICYAQTHRIKNQYGGFSDVLCLDQMDDGVPCPACQSDNFDIRKRSTKGYVNVIWRGTADEGFVRAPVYKMNDKGFPERDPNSKKRIVVGFEDSVFLWKCSKTILEQVFLKDAAYKGIMSRDFVVSRKGSEMNNTVYAIEPAVIDGGPEPMNVADATISSKKFDVVSLSTPGSYDEMVAMLSGQQSGGNQQSNFPRDFQPPEGVFSSNAPPMRSSAFAK